MKLQSIIFAILVTFSFPNSNNIIASNKSVSAINLHSIADAATKSNQVIMLYFSAIYCTYCMMLNEDVIQPMMVNEGYLKKVRVVEISLDTDENITDFNNKTISIDVLQSRYDIQVTPTLLFVDNKGTEIVQRIVGYQTKDFYWYYLDEAINAAKTN